MSDTPTTDRNWRTTVTLDGQRYGSPIAVSYDHRGPAEFKVDSEKTLRVEVYPENSDFEVVIALHLPGTWSRVSQEILPEEIDEATLDALREQLDDSDREIQVHDPSGEQDW